MIITNQGVNYSDKIKSALFGVAVGDALGVPVEFKSRQTIRKSPVTDMIGYGTYNLPPGTWSDDSLLTTENYRDAVLKAVNLGEDTDTTGAVTGGLAGLLYGFENIPINWIKQLARLDDVENLAERLGDKIS